ncbi:MAG: hypothetical protein A2X86_21625 [Bdellovibrionales bacterium GWA2_49_15]|nr:MAG: hypothetical protein A2X86_21625 [Bdellovibrionales bacterium GWA2_49_15]HAZ11567.1 hypothetical protein [Bdellovibrionales bacterium]
MKILNHLPAVLFLLMATASVWAQAPKLPLSLTARIDGPSGVEQVSLIFKEGKAIMVINSNFLTQGQWPVWLGVFERELDENLKLTETILTADSTSSPRDQSAQARELGPHRLQILLGENEVPASEPTYIRLKDTLLRMLDDVGTWKATAGAKVTKGPKGKLLYNDLTQTPAVSKTQPCPQKSPCKLSGLGLIWID